MIKNITTFSDDKKILSLKKKLIKIVKKKNKYISDKKNRKSRTSFKKDYFKTISEFEEIRGGNLIYPYLGSGRGSGCYVELADGSIKLDLINGIGVYHFGHNSPLIMEASLDASLCDIPIQGNIQQNIDSHKLSKKILKLANRDAQNKDKKNIKSNFSHVFLSSSGVMAGENALKLAFHNVNSQKSSSRKRILAFKNNFAGRTLTFSQINDKPTYRVGLPKNIQVDYISFFDADLDKKNIRASIDRSVAELRDFLAKYPDQYAGMIFELVQGEGGFWTAPREFFVELMKELKKHNVSVLVDEVQTFARTPEFFAFQYLRLEKYIDIVWIGKAAQVCATIFKKEFKPSALILAQTYTSSSSSIKSAIQILKHLDHGNYFGKNGKIIKIHNYFIKKLDFLNQKFAKKYGKKYTCADNENFDYKTYYRDFNYGIGAMIVFQPFGGDPKKVLLLSKKLFHNGLIVGVAGDNPMRIRFLPAIGVIKKEDINHAIKILRKSLKEILEDKNL